MRVRLQEWCEAMAKTESTRRIQDWHHILAFCAITAAISVGTAYYVLSVDPIPNPASVERMLVDRFIQVLLVIASVVFAIVVAALVYAVIFFRRQPGDDTDGRPIKGKMPLELAWTLIPLVIVVALSYHGGKVLDQMMATDLHHATKHTVYSLGAFVPGETAPAHMAEEPVVVDVTASRFIWRFGYPEQGIDATYELVVPVNRRIVFRIHSQDVIHSFWVQQWGLKQDAVPGLSPVLRITPTKTGQYAIECSQLCGFGHTDMTGPVRVVSGEEFEAWVSERRSSDVKSSPPPGTHVMVDLVAQNIVFDKSTITVPAGVMVMIDFDNRDKGVAHNFAVYKTPAAEEKIFAGQIITGPKRITYSFMAPQTRGDYFFRCDVHPKTMTGTLVVQ